MKGVSFRSVRKLQQEIEKYQNNNAFDLLEKYESSTLADFYCAYSFNNLYERNKFNHLPHLETSVSTYFQIKVPEKYKTHYTLSDHNGSHTRVKTDAGLELNVTTPVFNKLFEVKEKFTQGKLLDLIQCDHPERLPIKNEHFDLGFWFRISSTYYNQSIGSMPIDTPFAEKTIFQFLKTIDEKYEEFRDFDKYKKDSKEYNKAAKKIFKPMFKQIKKDLKKGGVAIH